MNIKFDWLLFFTALAISLFGLAMIFSAVHDSPLVDIFYKQAIFLGIAISFSLALWKIPARVHDGFAYIYYAVTIFLLVIVLFQSAEVKRWLGFGIFRIQPSELSKLVMIFAIGRWIRDHAKNIDNFFVFAGALALMGLPFVLILKEPDLGTAIVYWVVIFSMFYAGGIRPLNLFLILTPFFAMVSALHWIAWLAYFSLLIFVLLKWRVTPSTFFVTVVVAISIGASTPYVWSQLHPYQRERILVFLNPQHDPLGAGYQLIQSKITVGSGGILGKGYLEGSQTKLSFLPAKHSDFIFSVIGEQFGFAGAMALLFMFWVLLWRIMRIASFSRTQYGTLVAAGVAGVIFFQAFVNIAMTVGFAPVTGIPLPFVSAGGSALIVFWGMIGVMQNIHSQTEEDL